MKNLKLLLVTLLLFISASSFSQVLTFRTTLFATNEYNYYSQRWSGWSNWEKSDMLLTIDLSNDIITIFSPVTQVYKIYSYEESYRDSDGDVHIKYKFVDQDGDYGTLKLLQRANGASEIYIYFNNISWCYRVLRI